MSPCMDAFVFHMLFTVGSGSMVAFVVSTVPFTLVCVTVNTCAPPAQCVQQMIPYLQAPVARDMSSVLFAWRGTSAYGVHVVMAGTWVTLLASVMSRVAVRLDIDSTMVTCKHNHPVDIQSHAYICQRPTGREPIIVDD